MCRCSNGRSAPQTATFGDSCDTLSGISFNQPSEAKPIAQARLSRLLWLPGTTAAGSDGPKSAILTCRAPGGAAIWDACAQNGRDGLQDVPASLLEQSKAPTPPTRVPAATVQACFRGSNLFHFLGLSHPQASPEGKKNRKKVNPQKCLHNSHLGPPRWRGRLGLL